LPLRCGDLVEVRSAEEILASLDANGDLDGLPFMPEMLRFCGQKLRVERSAHKTCDTVTGQLLGRRVEHTVHLDSARCDGSAHGGCQANCLLFWRDAWLKPVEPERSSILSRLLADPPTSSGAEEPRAACTPKLLRERAIDAAASGAGEPVFRCQATRLLSASTPLAWWEPTQYLRDWWSGNVSLGVMLRGMLLRALYLFVVNGRGYRLKVHFYNFVARITGGVSWPYGGGDLTRRTPTERLDLQPGELVEVKSNEEILATLNGRMNRGLGFSPEMVKFCGQRFRVDGRVSQIIDEKTGKMLRMKSECITLVGVFCASDCSENRLFCPRRIPAYWREIWLRRVGQGSTNG